MVNSRGFLRVVEATVAVLLVVSAVIILSAREAPQERIDLGADLPPLLDELARNYTLRDEMISGDEEAAEAMIEHLLAERIVNPSLAYSVELCALHEPCFLDPYPQDIEDDMFVSERVISASVTNSTFSPKKVKLFLWRKVVS